MTLGGMAQDRGIGDALTPGGAVAANAVAGGAGDGTQTTGAEFDRLPPGPADAQRYDSCIVTAFLQATLAATETATLAFDVQESDVSGSGFASLAAGLQPANLVLTGGSGGTTEQGDTKHNLRLHPRKRFVRVRVTLTMSAGVTDVAAYGAGFIFGGAHVAPTP